MHELSLANDILQAIRNESQKMGGKRVREIRARIRESIHHMEDYSLGTCFEAVAKGTIAEGAKVTIEIIPPTLRCKECDFTFLAQSSALVCPSCRKSKLELIDADEIDLECDFVE